ncbi:hypothetical protein CBR_g26183 [Chara braunii]|uniref:Condensin complex subunit 2 n=1 Tax=Chara braunii TaxID=69332 RepID=A0A388L773_CHABU|nr:hypothetical protein CBR_g26183 [Chara braunii]|eukprot:GBG78147.1 hypothetical protein CBR_g26183 [Chara braunii]
MAPPLGHGRTGVIAEVRSVPSTTRVTSKTLKTPLLSPRRFGVLSPNNDETERQRARDARAAAQNLFRASGAEKGRQDGAVGEETGDGRSGSGSGGGLNRQQVLDLYQNCIKLASENKITQKNTWDLQLIDHISDIVKSEVDDQNQTNFQKASCTLDAGVKIYSCRVDSYHSEAFKVLGSLSSTAAEPRADGDKDGELAGAGDENGEEDDRGERARPGKRVSGPSTTLESTLDALNVKRFDATLAVDPLFHQTSAQFDEGGAKGLLLNNLSVHRGLEIIFDSAEVPDKCAAEDASEAAMTGRGNAVIDLSPTTDKLAANWICAFESMEITPSLREIMALLEDPARTAAEAELASEGPHAEMKFSSPDFGEKGAQNDIPADVNEPGEEAGPGSVDDGVVEDQELSDGDVASGFDGGGYDDFNDGGFNQEGGEGHENNGEDDCAESPFNPGDSKLKTMKDCEQAVNWLTAGRTGLTAKSNAWAGPDHWRFTWHKDASATVESHSSDGDGQHHKADKAGGKAKTVKKQPLFIDFFHPPEIDVSLFQPPKDEKETLFVKRTGGKSTDSYLLPDDHHYDPLRLISLDLRPNVMCVTRSTGKGPSGLQAMFGGEEGMDDNDADDDDDGGGGDPHGGGHFEGAWDDDTCLNSPVPDGNCGPDYADEAPGQKAGDKSSEHTPEMDRLLPRPRQVKQIEVTYARRAKQVDVKVLKETLWKGLHKLASHQEERRSGLVDSPEGGMDGQQEEQTRIGGQQCSANAAAAVSFRELLKRFPADCRAAESLADISVHMCFICLLHLGNEHGLRIEGSDSLEEVTVYNIG